MEVDDEDARLTKILLLRLGVVLDWLAVQFWTWQVWALRRIEQRLPEDEED